jgi:hypothetical protein
MKSLSARHFFCLLLLYFQLMLIYALTESDLKAFRDKLVNSSLPLTGIFSNFSLMYRRFKVNEQNLIDLEYGLERIRIENDYAEQRQDYQVRFADLKKQYKQVDNRITSVEQKLNRGIPEDMRLVERLITEQEAIVEEQEKLNAAELVLAQHKSSIDIAYGKAREKLEQYKTSRNAPLNLKFEQYAQNLDLAEKKIKSRTNLLALTAVISMPLLIEYIAIKVGIPVTLSKTSQHVAAVHYLFLVALILTEVLLAERLKNSIYSIFAIRYTKRSSSELLDLLSINNTNTIALEKNSGLTFHQVLAMTYEMDSPS